MDERYLPNHLSPGSTGVRIRAQDGGVGLVEERELQGWKGARICMTCQHFAYGVDQHCHTLVGCNLMQKQLQQGEHLTNRCQQWAPTWQKEVGWAPARGETSQARQIRSPAC